MANEVRIGLIRKVILFLLISSIGLFFGLIHYWIWATICGTTIIIGIIGALIVQRFHKRIKGGGPGGQGRQNTWMRGNFLMFMILQSIILSCIINGLCGSKHTFSLMLSIPNHSSSSSSSESCLEFTTNNNINHIYIFIMSYFLYVSSCVFIDMCYSSIPGQRSLLYLIIISWPSSIHFTSCILSLSMLPLYPVLSYISWHYFHSSSHYLALQLLPFYLYLFLFTLSISGLFDSLFTRWTYVDIHHYDEPLQEKQEQPEQTDQQQQQILTKTTTTTTEESDRSISRIHRRDFKEWSVSRVFTEHLIKEDTLANQRFCLKICQITDPHIGPLCSVARLQQLCREVVNHNPDLVLLTGDYYTGEANMDGLLEEALSPLKSISDRCYACLGNHDMESTEVLKRCERELKALNIRLLRDECFIHTHNDQKIQIVGFDYVFYTNPNRGKRMLELLQNNPLPKDCYHKRIVLLHDPSGFNEFVGDENLMVFSGHTHGGHVGFLSCGLSMTILSLVSLRLPDNGLWKKGNNRLYVHRGQGSRGMWTNFVLRVGVPTEQSLVRLFW